ncbi:hypothetical protein MMYC01_206368 [Madurella mycetomatis]|uniref:Uncharacterized protein n=1 Tax=Madurella mycetomatis TaxID=100816 RepID=A0A175W5H1_9PEZI|nr:hypothetical protein MMYC01_206368 [Madurella mycetomatis]
MRTGELATRALLGGLAMEQLDMVAVTSPNPAGLLIRQSGCEPGWTLCGEGCMPIGNVCCASYVLAPRFANRQAMF